MPNIEKNITSVERRLQQAAREADRNPDDILLLAVSKTQTSAQVRLAIDAGLGSFGENYLEEAIRKIEQLKGRSINWHFIGSLQSNKTKQAAENFSWVHTVDR
ncbi:MAG: YggS family pyridoxal phosphate enzyme, partial [Porticoccaceae bacterium]|nr:YggS family pyridoxal phosphate enzyme [Porticoccaceae bacterium]